MITHPLVCADSGLGKIMRFSAVGVLEWQFSPACSFDLWVLPGNNILFSEFNGPRGGGVREVNTNKEIVFEYFTGGEVFGCQPLADGRVLIGDVNACRLVEVDRQGKVLFALPLESRNKGHDSMRLPRKLSNGNYLVCHKGDQDVREYDRSGAVVWECHCPGPVFVAIRLPDGNTLVSCEEELIEVDETGKIVWDLCDRDVPGIGIRLLTGLQRLPNGNTVISNWLGHHPGDRCISLFEVDRKKNVVWQFANPDALQETGSFQCLDVLGDVTRGEILR